jgi:hypothetical protein
MAMPVLEAAPLSIVPPNLPEPRVKRPWLRWIVRLAVILALLLGGAEICRLALFGNVHTVVPDRVYRGATLAPETLEALVKRHNIQTIVNLRGCCHPNAWYVDQVRTVQKLQIAQEDVSFSAGRLPAVTEIRRLIEVLDHARYPVYLHCFRGADRTGLAAAMVFLLHEPSSLAEARWQLSLRYGHLALGRPAYLDQFLDLYEEWLGQHGLAHSAASFRRWALQEYRGAWCSYRIDAFEPLPGDRRVNEPLGFRVRFRNTGTKTWHFRPQAAAGFHVGYNLLDADDRLKATGKSGLLEADVPPGESIDLTLIVAPIAQAGRYRLRVDLVEEGHCWFYQTGAELLEQEIEIRE